LGLQGALPLIRSLLDWLLWTDGKITTGNQGLIKSMVNSATYRQAAVMTKKQWDKMDPEQRIAGRAPLQSHQREFVRDINPSEQWLAQPGNRWAKCKNLIARRL